MIEIKKKRELTIKIVVNKWMKKTLTRPIVKIKNSKNVSTKAIWTFIALVLFAILAQKITASILEYSKYESFLEPNNFNRQENSNLTIGIMIENSLDYQSLKNTDIISDKEDISEFAKYNSVSTLQNFDMSYKSFWEKASKKYQDFQKTKDLKNSDDFNGFLTNMTKMSIISCYFNDQICSYEDFKLLGSDDPRDKSYSSLVEFNRMK
jgi:hypothetical protein